MTKPPKDQPAFPGGVSATRKPSDDAYPTQPGMTKLEYVATAAMKGLIASSPETGTANELLERPNNYAKWAVLYAKALLAELEKEKA